MGNLVFQATLGGQVNLVGPNTASTFNINVPTVNGNMVTTGDTGTVTNTMLAGSIANAKLTNSSLTIGSTSISLGATSTTLAGLTSVGTTTVGAPSSSNLSIQSNGTTNATLDTSGNLGLGVTPSAWGSGSNGIEISGKNGQIVATTPYLTLGANTYYNGSNYIYKTSGTAAYYQQNNPTTAPIQNPNTEGFLPFITSKNIHAKPAAAAAVLVVAKAFTANAFAPNAEPALKPNQPNHNKPVPINT